MNSHDISILVVLVFVAAAVAALFVQQKQFRFKKRRLMSGNELEFFQRICRAVPDGHVFPQVAMSALIEPATSRGKLYQAAFRRISQKRVDYAVLDGNMKLLVVIELDDITHNARQDARRDAYLKSAGITTIRYDSRHKPPAARIQADLIKLGTKEKS